MHGNVYEWVYDWFARTYAGAGQQDPVGPVSGTHRVQRGGGYVYTARYARSAFRLSDEPGYRSHDFGFRLVLRPSP